MPNGYVSWSDPNRIYDVDNELKGNLRKAPKLSYQAFHGKQNTKCCACYFIASWNHDCCCQELLSWSKGYFKTLYRFTIGVTISNSEQRYSPNPLGNANFAEWWKNQLSFVTLHSGFKYFLSHLLSRVHIHCANIISINKHTTFASNAHPQVDPTEENDSDSLSDEPRPPPEEDRNLDSPESIILSASDNENVIDFKSDSQRHVNVVTRDFIPFEEGYAHVMEELTLTMRVHPLTETQ